MPPADGGPPPRPSFRPALTAATTPHPPKPGFTNSFCVDNVPSPAPGGGVEGGAGVAAVPIFTSTQ